MVDGPEQCMDRIEAAGLEQQRKCDGGTGNQRYIENEFCCSIAKGIEEPQEASVAGNHHTIGKTHQRCDDAGGNKRCAGRLRFCGTIRVGAKPELFEDTG